MPDDPTLDEELQQIFEAEVAREPTPPPAAPEEPPVPAVVDPLIDRENRRISMESSLHEGQTTPTQDAVDATTIANARGLPSEGVFADIERSRVSYAAQGLAAMIDVDMSPATADFISNPIHAALVDQEDVANPSNTGSRSRNSVPNRNCRGGVRSPATRSRTGRWGSSASTSPARSRHPTTSGPVAVV